MKTQGQKDYEEDCRKMPVSPHNGKKRQTWNEIDESARRSWELQPRQGMNPLMIGELAR